MTVLAVAGLAKRYGDRTVLRGVTFAVARGDRVGIVGPNGSGKSTLLRALALREVDEGRVTLARGTRVGFLEQELASQGAGTVDELVAHARRRLDLLEAQLRALESRLAEPGALERYGELQAAFEHAGGYEFDALATRVLAGLGLGAIGRDRPLATLSGGERARDTLAALLLEDPDFLLLDEPTNHLDLAALEWLETFLLERERTVLVVSHDRYFLDCVTARTLALAGGTVRAYRGGYAAYLRERSREELETSRRAERQSAAIAHDEAFIERERAGQRARQARGRMKRLARIERVAPVERRATIHWRPEVPPLGSPLVVETTPLVLGVEAPILRTPALRVERGTRVAIMGPNGAGKTTLLRALTGDRFPLEGFVRAAPGARVAVFAQSGSAPLHEGSVVRALQASTPLTEQEARDHLARFLFRGDDVFREVATLSGGERARLALAVLASRAANVLALDEPTNHLDLEAREALEEVLSEYEGTLLLVTHDRYLADRVATHTWLLSDGGLTAFEGNYSKMRRTLEDARPGAQARGVSAPEGPPRAAGSGRRPGAGSPAGRRGAGMAKGKARRDRRPGERGPGAAAARLSSLEARITALEGRLAELAQRVGEVASRGNYLESRRVGQEYAELEKALRALYDEWAHAGEERP